MIALLGTGLLGTGFANAWRRQGAELTVWNRTAAKALPLLEIGAKVAPDPAAAVANATRVHVILSDDTAVDEVVAQAMPRLAKGCLVIDHSTTSVTGTRARAERLKTHGLRFLHAPVFMGPKNAHDASGVMMVSGPPDVIEDARAALTAMTGKLVELGPAVDTAAGYKLLGNLFIMFLTTGLADLLALGTAVGIAPTDASRLFDFFNPGASVGGRLRRMIEGDFEAVSWMLEMARKDARLMLEEAERAGKELAVLPAIAARMDALIAQGAGRLDWSVLARTAIA